MRVPFCLFLALATSGCVSPYVAIPYESDQVDVRSIAVIEDVGDVDVMAYEVANVGANFGLVGALVDAGVQASRRQRVEDVFEDAGFDAQGYFRDSLLEELLGLGYEVTVVDLASRDEETLLEAIPPAPAESDAVLDVVLQNYGFISAGMGVPFRPHAQAEAQLTLRDGQTVAMRHSVQYAPMGSPEGHIVLSPDPLYAFNNRTELLADPERLISGVKLALDESAEALARQIAP